MQRWPIVGTVAAVLLGSVFLYQVPNQDDPVLVAADPSNVRSAIYLPSPLTASWYCAIGTSDASGYADHTVHITNASGDEATATLSIVTEDGPGPALRLELGAFATESVDLNRVTSAENSAVVVEIVGGQGVVGHDVETQFGLASGPCSSTVAGNWYFASGSTRRDTNQYLALMNPFGEDVVLDVVFRTATRERRPEDLTSFPVQGRTVKIINVADYVSIEPVVATTITAIQGRVVAEQLQVVNGELGPSGAALTLGVAGPSTEWNIPAGRVTETGDHQLVIFNPGDQQSEIELSIDLSTTEQRAAYGLVPIELTVQPGRFESLDIADLLGALQVPLPIEFGVRVVADNGVPVVVSRSQLYPLVDNSLVGAEDSGATVEVAGGEADVPPDPSIEPDESEIVEDPDREIITVDPTTIERRDPVGSGAITSGDTLGGNLLRQDGEPEEDEDDIAIEDLVSVSLEQIILGDSAQASPLTGLSARPGYAYMADQWVVPYHRYLPEGGTVLLISAPLDALVSIRGMAGGRLLEPQRVAVTGETRRVVSVVLPVPQSALWITSDAPIAIEVQTVDLDGRLTVTGAVPVLSR
ncbi:MAG: hypothetical protein HKN03_02590 [Acidimicrobiales bacterium]|nr:hypothetical protein [Acidimicrobiales bacterium]